MCVMKQSEDDRSDQDFIRIDLRGTFIFSLSSPLLSSALISLIAEFCVEWKEKVTEYQTSELGALERTHELKSSLSSVLDTN